MNKFLYRIIFNKSRGLLMVVAENVSAQGKQPGIDGARGGPHLIARLRPLQWALLLAFGAVGMEANAQIMADPQAPGTQRATVLSAGNGVPLVNIQTPSAAGVSRNTYKQFDVSEQGAILNNSRTATATQLGGYVPGNPWLATGTARVILNEINASNPSLLRGYVEVGGAQAEVIIANPAGINCEGCGVINVNRLTLSTGAPQLSGGSLDGYRVQRGVLAISGKGLDVSGTDYTELIARSVEINAGLWATELEVVTGTNAVDAEGQLAPLAGTGSAPRYGIDVAELGGMYAGKIILVGTEAGVGVRNAGEIGASAGEVRLTAEGRIENSGQLSASTDLRLITQGSLINSGMLYAGGEAMLDAEGDITSSGTLEAEGLVSLDAGGSIANSGTLVAQTDARLNAGGDIANSGIVAAQGDVPLNAGGDIRNSGSLIAIGYTPLNAGRNIDNSGTLQTGRDAVLNAGADITNSGTLAALGDIPLTAGGSINNSGMLDAQGRTPLRAGDDITNSGTLQTERDATLTASRNIDNSGTLVAVGALPLIAGGDISNSGALQTESDVSLIASGDIANSGTVHAFGNTQLSAGGDIDNTGTIAAQVDTTLAALGVDSRVTSHIGSVIAAGVLSDGTLGGNGDVEVTTTGPLVAQGRNFASGDLALVGASIDLSHSQSLARNLTFAASSGDINASEAIVFAAELLHVSTPETLRTDGASVTAEQLVLDARVISNVGGTLQQTGTRPWSLQLSGALDNSGGTVMTGGALTLAASELINRQGTITAVATLSVKAVGAVDNWHGFLASHGDTDITAASVQNNAGIIGSQQGGLSINALTGALDNTAGWLQAAQTLTVNARGMSNVEGMVSGLDVVVRTQYHALDNNRGVVVATGDLNLSTGLLINDTGTLQAGDYLGINSAGMPLSNTSGGSIWGRNVELVVGMLNNSAGFIGAADTLALWTDLVINRGGTLQSGGSLLLDTQGQAFDNEHGAVVAGGRLMLRTGALDNDAGAIQAGGPMTIDTNGQALSNRDSEKNGGIRGLGSVTLRTGALDNTQGAIVATEALDMVTGAVINDAGLMYAGGALTLDTQGQAVSNRDAGANGGIVGLSSVDLHTGDFDNRQGMIVAAGTLDLLTGGLLNDGGLLRADGALTLDTQGHAASNRDSGADGGIIGLSTVSLKTGTLDNSKGLIAALDTLDMLTAAITNDVGLMQAGGALTLDTQGQALNNRNTSGVGGIWGLDAVTLRTGTVDNSLGAIVASKTLDMLTGAMTNIAGLVQAGGALTLRTAQLTNDTGIIQTSDFLNIDTQGQSLSNLNTLNGAGIFGLRGVDLQSGNLDNGAGFIGSGGNLALSTAQASNVGGTLQGVGTVTLNTQGQALINQQGIVIAGTALTLGTGFLNNVDGLLQAGTNLTLNSGQLDNSSGTIAANGAADLDTGQVFNTGGLLQAGGLFSLNTHGQTLDNSQGNVIGQSNVTLTTGNLSNVAGYVGSRGALTVNAAVISNLQGGQILSTRSAQIAATTLNNSGGVIQAAENLRVAATSAINNDAGLIQSNATLTLTAQSIDNSDTLADDLGLRGEDIAITAGELDNASGTISAADYLALDVSHNAAVALSLDNSEGVITAGGALDLDALNLRNDKGLMQAGAKFYLDTHGKTLDNSHGELIGLSDVTLKSGDLLNTAGAIAAKGALEAEAARIDNREEGQIISTETLTLHGIAQGALATEEGTALDNRGGFIQALDNLDITVVGDINNDAGLIQSNATLTLEARGIANRNTLNTTLGLRGANITLTAADLANATGTVNADKQLTLNVNHWLDNTGGLISSPERVDVHSATALVININGVFIAGDWLSLDAAELRDDGYADSMVVSLGDLNLHVAGDFTNSSLVAAVNDATMTIDGTLTNLATLGAGGILDATASNLTNAYGATLSAGSNRVKVTGSLTNRGLIDGGDTFLTSGSLNNLGTGRIYGDHVAIQAGSLLNDVEGTAPVIAARQRMDLAVGTLTNRDHAQLLSLGDLMIGGQLDANHNATGSAGAVYNQSATIQAMGNLSVAAGMIVNEDIHFSMGTKAATESIHEYQGLADPVNQPELKTSQRYLAGTPGLYTYTDESLHLWTPNITTGFGYQVWDEFSYTRTTVTPIVLTADAAQMIAGGSLTLTANTAVNDKSHLIAGGALNLVVGNMQNINAIAQKTITDNGTVTHHWRERQDGDDISGSDTIAYAPAAITQEVVVLVPVAEQYATTGSAYVPTQTTSSVTQLAQGAGAGTVSVDDTALPGSGPGLNSLANLNPTQNLAANPTLSDQGRPSLDLIAGSLGDKGQDLLDLMSGTKAVPWTQVAGKGLSRQPSALSVPAMPGAASFVARVNTNDVVRIATTPATVPNSSLYTIDPNRDHLVNIDPNFINGSYYLSSDYLLQILGLNPAVTQARLGDGYYEQELVRQQIVQLTGQRFLNGYADDQTQYQALLAAGATYAQEWNLIPGVALSAEQVAQLTSDIVWLVAQTVTLPDGSTQNVLVPQVYAVVQAGDLDGSGALMAGRTANFNLSGDLTNSGNIGGQQLVMINAENINNLGRITGGAVGVNALVDVNNIGGTIDAKNTLAVIAGNDINLISTTSSNSTAQSTNTLLDRIAGLYVTNSDGGNLLVSAGNDVNLLAARISNASDVGKITVLAGNDINLNTVNTGSSLNLVFDPNNYRKEASTQEIGSTITGNGITLGAGSDLFAKGASVTSSNGGITAVAGNDITLTTAQSTYGLDQASKRDGETGGFASFTVTTRDTLDMLTNQGSLFSGNTVTMSADNDITVIGSNVVSDLGTTLNAGNDLTITTATDTLSESNLRNEEKDGLFGTGGIGFTIGSQSQSNVQQLANNTVVGSTIGSTQGDVTLNAGNAYTQIGSDVLAPQGDIDITAKEVSIIEARETTSSTQSTSFEQSGLTVSLTAPIIAGAQTVQQMSEAASNTEDERMQALAAASGALAVKNATDAMQDDPTAFNLSITLGRSESESSTTQTTNTSVGSNVVAGGNVNITATGAGKDSDITIQGSNVNAGNNATLDAEGDINLLASQNTSTLERDSSSSSKGAGVAVTDSSFGVTASASSSQGEGNGADVSNTNTTVNAGNTLTLNSGGDTNLKGAVASGSQVIANVGGDLNLESLQDTSTFQSEDQSIGGSVTAGPGFSGGSLTASQTTINSDYASVTEQTGIRAGDGGFQINVNGNTDLKGAVITSTDEAVANGLNSFTTGSLILSDIQNSAEYEGRGLGLSLGAGSEGGLPNLSGAGVGSESGSANSTTQSGISGIAGNTQARTGDAETGITPIFDAQRVQEEINAQVQITQAFGQQAGKVVDDYVTKGRTTLYERLEEAPTPDERERIQQQINELNTEERVMNVLIGVVTGQTSVAVAQATLSQMADQMRQAMIEDSTKFAGITDGKTEISNLSGDSEGVRGDGQKIGGTRVDLDILCGTDNRQCKKNDDRSLQLDDQGRIQFDPEAAKMSLEEFLTTNEGKKAIGAAGGVQGMAGSLLGVPYLPGSWLDKLVEAFSGPHDTIGSSVVGLYDDQGNATRGRSEITKTAQEVWSASGAIVLATPLATAELLPPEVWNAIAALIEAAK